MHSAIFGNQWNGELPSNFSEMEIPALLSGIRKIAVSAEAVFNVQQSQKVVAMAAERTRKQCEEIYPMTLTDVLSKEEWAEFEKELYDRWQISATVYDASGVSITGKPNWCNRLCPQIKSNKDSLAAICAPGNQNFMAMARQTKKPVIGECDAGLMKIAVPIYVNGDFLGTAGGCGLLPEGGEVENFLIERSMGLDEEKINEFCDGLGTMTEAQAKEMATVIEKRIEQYIAKAPGK